MERAEAAPTPPARARSRGRSSASSPICTSARRSCTRITASAAIAASRRSTSTACPRSSCCSNTRAATSCTCRCRACTSSRATPARPPEDAPLHRLGTDQWEKAKRKAAEQARDIGRRAARISMRSAQRARARSSRSTRTAYQRFALEFPFEETEDQLTAIERVLADLASERPMDRVVCGDVGFGKTEVALRAAFVAVQAGYRWPCSCRPRCSRSSTTAPSRTASPTGRCASSCCRGSAARAGSTEALEGLAEGTRRHRDRHAPAAASRT